MERPASRPGRSEMPDRVNSTGDFMQHMVTHHQAGVQMARLMVEKDIGPETATLAQLIVAEQTREALLLRNWWRSWFDEMMRLLPPQESAGIPGMPSDEDLRRLRAATGEEAERDFLALMEAPHRGAVIMADEAQARARDPRLRTFAYSVRHAQSGQIRWMAGLLVTDAPRLPRRPSLVHD